MWASVQPQEEDMPTSRGQNAPGYIVFPDGSDNSVFDPADLKSIQAIFDDCMRECSFNADSEKAKALGSAIIRLYSQGHHDPIFVKALLLPSFQRRH